MARRPSRLPTVVTDRILAGFGRIGDMTIRAELELDEHVDEGRLRDALLRAREAEPVLGCRFVDRALFPFWEPVLPAPEPLVLLSSAADLAAWRLVPLDGHAGPQLTAGLWRAPDGDRLLVKVGHLAADAGATKEILARVSGLYRRLATEPGHRPTPNVAGARGWWQVLRRVPFAAWRSGWRRFVDELRASSPRVGTLKMPVAPTASEGWELATRELPSERVAELKRAGRVVDATLNDLLVAAFFRAQARLGRWDGRQQLRISTTVDLRRYLPGRRGGASCNLSAFDYPILGAELGATPADTLRHVVSHTRARKADWLGMSGVLGMVVVFKRLPHVLVRQAVPFAVREAHKRGVMADGLTNLGEIAPEAVTFERPARAARLLVPPADPPVFVAGVSGYAGSLTLSLGFRPGSHQGFTAADWFDAWTGELVG